MLFILYKDPPILFFKYFTYIYTDSIFKVFFLNQIIQHFKQRRCLQNGRTLKYNFKTQFEIL